MKSGWKFAVAAVTVAGLLSPTAVFATNGMNLEGYGPVACALGGASMAYENGTAAVMNNPATLGLMEEGTSRLDLAIGRLGPDVTASVMTPGGPLDAGSSADAFYMPAVGYAKKTGRFTYGFGTYAQGGMGTEFEANSWMSDPSQGANTALSAGLINRSEVSIGRFLVPVVGDVNEWFKLGGSVDFVWAGVDLQMAMSQAQFMDLTTTQQAGTASGSIVTAFNQMMGTGAVNNLYHAYFDFSNDSPFSGQAKNVGVAGKLGAVFTVRPDLNFGVTYHSPTALQDLTTDEAVMSMGVSIDTGVAMGGAPSGTYMDAVLPVKGEIQIDDFQWPATVGAGFAYRASEQLSFAADVRQVFWSDVMEDFTMTFTASSAPENGGFAGQSLEATLYQNWEDQTVFSLGAEYLYSPKMAFRAGYNRADNPVPEGFLNALFPAIVESHAAVGVGYVLNPQWGMDFALSHAFETSVTNPGNGATVPPVESSHQQTNMQLMFTRTF